MDDAADIRFIQTHSKSHSGHHYSELSAHEIILDPPALRRRQTGVIRLSLPLQWLTDLLSCCKNRLWSIDVLFQSNDKYELRMTGLTQLLLSVWRRVVLAAAANLFVFFNQHSLQAGSEQSCYTGRLLSSGAVDDDGVQTTKSISFQQGHQSLESFNTGWDAYIPVSFFTFHKTRLNI